MDYEITYQAHNVYQEAVNEAIFEFRIVPCNDDTQVVLSNDISNSAGESSFHFKNLFGFEVYRVRTVKPFKEFTFKMKSVLQKKKPAVGGKILSLEEERGLLMSNDFLIDHYLYLTITPYTKLANVAAGKIFSKKTGQSAVEYLQELNLYINQLLAYTKKTTDVKTTAAQALKLKSGVCQDFVHLFIAMARLQHIPCRYVSGYLNQGKRFIGASQMHAWVEAYIPGVGWMGLDPTNKRLVDEHYIKVSHGTDYNDCSPIKGVLKTHGENKTSYQVKVVAR